MQGMALLYRFRFATSHLLTQTLGIKDKSKMNQRLRVLAQQEYVGRNYTPEYRLQGKHASYFSLPKGIKALKQLGMINAAHRYFITSIKIKRQMLGHCHLHS